MPAQMSGAGYEPDSFAFIWLTLSLFKKAVNLIKNDKKAAVRNIKARASEIFAQTHIQFKEFCLNITGRFS